MNDFSQNGIVANLHDFSFKRTKHIEDELLNFSKYNKMELILPCLYSELQGSALPKIVDEISKAKYLNHVIIGLDRADKKQAIEAWNFFKKLEIPHTILWNDGPGLKKLDKELGLTLWHQANLARKKCVVLYWNGISQRKGKSCSSP